MSGARRLEMNGHHPDLSLACQCAVPYLVSAAHRSTTSRLRPK